MTRLPIGLLALALLTPAAAASPPPKLDWDQLAPRTCGNGRVVVNAVQKVVNHVERGRKGNVWAFDNYTRAIKVWRIGAHNFCSIVTYAGTFRTIAGASPAGTGTVPAGVTGRFQGGYRMDFSGTLRSRPARRTLGFIGTLDYRCDAAGNCPGSVYWVTLYFSHVAGDEFDWWGWLYKAGRNGTWLNSISGSKGDIAEPKKPAKTK